LDDIHERKCCEQAQKFNEDMGLKMRKCIT
jgi:hypothetical protein